MRTKGLMASGIVVVVALGPMPVAASAAQLSDKKLEAIAADAMTPLPPALRTEGDSKVDVTTTANPERGLDLCENGERAGLYALPPQVAVTSLNDVSPKSADGSPVPLSAETTVDISRYASVAEAKRAWRGVLRALTKRCAGATYVPNSQEILGDGTEVIWTGSDFNQVDVASAKSGPVGLMTMFTNVLYSAEDPNRLVSSQVVQQYSSWRLIDNTIVRAMFARQWAPATTAPPIDPTSPAVTDSMKKVVDRMALKAAMAISQD